MSRALSCEEESSLLRATRTQQPSTQPAFVRRYLRVDKIVRSRAAVTIFVWTLTIVAGADFLYFSIPLYLPEEYLTLCYAASALLFPLYALAGFLGDVKLGRHLAVSCGLYSMLVLIALECLSLAAILPGILFTTGRDVSFLIAVFSVPTTIVRVMYFTNVIQFGTDQLYDLPVDHQSLFIHWYYFIYVLGQLLASVPASFRYFRSDGSPVSAAVGSGLFVLFSAVSTVVLVGSWLVMRYRRQWFLQGMFVVNPYRLVFRVTRFASQHKVPVRRSAFTYCEDELPSGLDLGKSKYGGPFTTEQVEDVKSFYEVSKVILALGPAYFLAVAVNSGGVNPPLMSKLANNAVEDVALTILLECLPLVLILVSLLLYLCVVRPLVLRYIPGMLKRMGLGIAVTILTLVLIFVTSIVTADAEGDFFVCHISSSDENNASEGNASDSASLQPDLGVPVLVVIAALNSLSYMLVNIARYEFICAQSPKFMKGFLIGLSLMVLGLFEGLGFALDYVLSVVHVPSFWCDIIYYLINIVVGVVCLLVYVYVARKYKYRRRDDICPVYRYVEEYYSKTVQQRRTALD